MQDLIRKYCFYVQSVEQIAYGVENQEIETGFPAGGKIFLISTVFSMIVGVQPASCLVLTRGALYPRCKVARPFIASISNNKLLEYLLFDLILVHSSVQQFSCRYSSSGAEGT